MNSETGACGEMDYTPAESRYIKAIKQKNKIQKSISIVERIVELRQKKNPSFGWEMLPWFVQYYPLIIKYTGHLKKVTALNPGMDGLGGLIGASKMEILSHLASDSYAATLFIPEGTSENKLLTMVQEKFTIFPDEPLICKPNKGERSINVQRVIDLDELRDYCKNSDGDFLVQEYIPGPEELGVSCFRNLDTGRMEIAAIVKRNIAKARGDGVSSIRQLIADCSLTDVQKGRILDCYSQKQADSVPEKDELVMISPVASLSFGTVIEEVHREENPEGFSRLEDSINRLCTNDQGIPYDGFNYGRFDYRSESLEALFDGRGKILELNGAAAMALHACVPGLLIDKRYDIFETFFDRMLKICEANKKAGNGRYMLFFSLYRYSRKQLHRTSVQWDAVKAAIKEIRQAAKSLKHLKSL
ncbi:MAG: hypothetical protein HQ557_01780 [Bacteroidetes bacterium]|nr:hypothetical protein [Bacteroidota bacterium]